MEVAYFHREGKFAVNYRDAVRMTGIDVGNNLRN